MNNYLYIGSAPCDEDCAQVGTDGYREQALKECNALLAQMHRKMEPEPDGAQLALRWHPHDFGSYASVVCYYDPNIEEAIDYAVKCENNLPENWDEQAREELGLS
ncbi:MAG: hypothetical protein CMB80_01025 [Flammeovirgaceae bacterium]|nr:hypothetical protein [Flammeovirgaceae bacterium]|tara:strand:+ start:3521 stop:3835 length:315 start_codon:yes stop_codon:yes gene_type:complete